MAKFRNYFSVVDNADHDRELSRHRDIKVAMKKYQGRYDLGGDVRIIAHTAFGTAIVRPGDEWKWGGTR